MSVNRTTSGPSASDEPVVHNSVLIRTHEPGESKRWIMPAILGAFVVIGVAAWAYVESQPAPPVVNHAVGEAPTSG
ncbi:MAG: hypothetical protein JO127_00590 [Caulobacteraceae bacterium]|nr:hypothetical protein [Caulobacteraceae bacterium]